MSSGIALLSYSFFGSWGWAEVQEDESLHVATQLGSIPRVPQVVQKREGVWLLSHGSLEMPV